MSKDSYREKLEIRRKQRDERAASNSLDWINLAGLFWLEEGENSFGSDENNKICLPGFPHAYCGSFVFNAGSVRLQPAQGISITMNGEAPDSRPLRSDREEPDLVEVGSLTMKIIIRGDVTLLRIWDRESSVRKNFTGFKYYPIDPKYQIAAKFTRYDPPRLVKSVDMIGTEIEGLFLGQAQFSLDGVNCTLEGEKSGEKILFHFDDKTKTDTTYGGGRKFSVPAPSGDEIMLDFNLAENWPCAYTPYATCPVTPTANRLADRIEAGEKKFFE
jgi:uncharacterized protein